LSKDNERFYRSNEQIKASPVTLINDEGRNLGSVVLVRAMEMARQCDLDLVEIAPGSRPPVCRIMDFGKFKFDQKLKERKQRKKQSKISQVKEIRLSPSIQKHDIETKSKSARRFIEEGHKVNIKLEFKRREIAHREIGDKVMGEFISGLVDVCEILSAPRPEGRNTLCTIGPKEKKIDIKY